MKATSLLILLLPFFTLAGDWTQFRGAKGDGTSTEVDLPIEWDKKKNIAWKVPVPEGWSSPVLADGKIYLTGAGVGKRDDGGLFLHVLCLDAADGKRRWQVPVFRQDSKTAPKIHKKNSNASPTPILEDGRLYAHFGHQGTACIELETQKVLWRFNEFKYKPVHGNGGSPLIAGDHLIFSCDGAADPFVAALNKNTGKIAWKKPREMNAKKKFSFCTPTLIEAAGRQQVVLPGSDAVSAYDPKTGDEIWRVTYDGYSVVPRPVFGHGLVFISTGFDRPVLMAIRPDGQGDVTKTHVEWTTKKAVSHTPSMLQIGAELYQVSDRGIASCLDAKTGDEHWTERIGGNHSASPVYAEGRIYFLDEGGTSVVIQAGTAFKELAKNELEERTLASMAVGNRALFVRGADHLYKIGQ